MATRVSWGMWSRGWRAARIDRSVFIEVREDPGAVLHAVGLVAVAGISLAVGSTNALALDQASTQDFGGLGERLVDTWIGVFAMIMGWTIWGGLIYLLVGRFLGGKANFNQTLRAVGLGYGPAVLLTLSPLAPDGAVQVFVWLWVLVISLVAVRTVHEIDWIGAFFPTVMGWFIFFVVLPNALTGPAS